MPIHPNGTIVRVRKRLLQPPEAAAGLAAGESDPIADLTVVGRTARAGRRMYVLRHDAVDRDLYAAEVDLQQAVSSSNAAAAAAAAAEGETDDDDDEDDDDDDEGIDDDLFFDLEDEVAAEGVSPQAPAAVAWEPLGSSLRGDIDHGRRSARAARVHFGALDVGILKPGQLFRTLFPPSAARSICLATTAAWVKEEPLGVDELFGFFGLMLRCTETTRPRAELWRPTSAQPWYPNPDMASFMPLRRFNAIASAMRLSIEAESDVAAVRQLLEQWNEHTLRVYTPSGTVCLDENTISHTPTASSAGQSLPRRPTPASTEYHTLCDAETRVVVKMELSSLARGGEYAEPAVTEDEAKFGKRGGLALRMARPFYSSGTVVVMDSAFCVVAALLEMQRRGVFAAAVVRKRRDCWPRHLDGVAQAVDTMRTRPVGQLHARRGASEDQVPIAHFFVNHGNAVVQLLSTYGSGALGHEQRKVRTEDKVLSYRRNAVLDDYCRARRAADLHSRICQGQQLALERAWSSRRWPLRQLAFVLSATLVNAYFVYLHFGGHKRVLFSDFRRRVETELAHGEKARRQQQQVAAAAAHEPPRPRQPSASTGAGAVGRIRNEGTRHQLAGTAPRWRRSTGAGAEPSHVLVHLKKNEGAVPGKRTKKDYQQQRCKGEGCSTSTRTYCACDRSLFLCLSCFAAHVTAAAAGGIEAAG